MSALPAFGLAAPPSAGPKAAIDSPANMPGHLLSAPPESDSRDFAGAVPGHLLSAQRPLSRVFLAIEQERLSLAIGVGALCREAAVDETLFRRYRSGRVKPGRANLQQLQSALDRLAKRNDGDTQERTLRAAFGGFLVATSRFYKVKVEIVRKLGSTNKDLPKAIFMRASDARQLALYLVNQEVGLRQADAARLVGQSRVAVHLAVRAIEDRRDAEPKFDRAVRRIISDVTGEQGGI